MVNVNLQNLTPKQQKGLAALLSEPTLEAAANAAKVSRVTLYDWLREPAFKAAYEQLQQDVFAEGLQTLKASLSEGVAALRAALKDADATPANRIAAATKLVELSFKAREQFDIDQRLDHLEKLLEAQARQGGMAR